MKPSRRHPLVDLDLQQIYFIGAISRSGRLVDVAESGLDAKLRKLPLSCQAVMVAESQREMAKLCCLGHVEVLAAASLDAALGAMIARQGRQRLRESALHRVLKPLNQDDYLEQRRRGFVGRAWLLEPLEDGDPAALSIYIEGKPGMGKSAVIAEIRHRYEERVLGFHCCDVQSPETWTPACFTRSMLYQFYARFPHFAESDQPDALEQDLKTCTPLELVRTRVLDRLPAGPSDARLYLIDGLDIAHAFSTELTQFVAGLVQSSAGRMRIIITSRDVPEIRARFSGLAYCELGGKQNDEDAREFVRVRLAELHHVGEGAAAEALLIEKSACNFYYLALVLDGLRSNVYSLADLPGLPKGLDRLYLDLFERAFRRGPYGLARRVLALLLAAREPMLDYEILRAACGATQRALDGVLRTLASVMEVRKSPSASFSYRIYHQSLREWLLGEDLPPGDRHDFVVNSEDLGRAHRDLGKAGLALQKNHALAKSAYFLRWLPQHLRAGGMDRQRHMLLKDLDYLQACVDNGLVGELHDHFAAAAADAGAAPDGRVFRQLALALARSAGFLSKHPGAFVQEMTNLCAWGEASGGLSAQPEAERPGG